jgi:hypothetical protein
VRYDLHEGSICTSEGGLAGVRRGAVLANLTSLQRRLPGAAR